MLIYINRYTTRLGIYDTETEKLKYCSIQQVNSIISKKEIVGLKNTSISLGDIGSIKFVNQDINNEDIFSEPYYVVLNKPIKIVSPPKYFKAIYKTLSIEMNNERKRNSNHLIISLFPVSNYYEYDMETYLRDANSFIRNNSHMSFTVVLPIRLLKSIDKGIINIESLFKGVSKNTNIILSSTSSGPNKFEYLNFGISDLKSFIGFKSLFSAARDLHYIDFGNITGDISNEILKTSRLPKINYWFNPICSDFCVYIFNKNYTKLYEKFFSNNTQMILLGTIKRDTPINNISHINQLLGKYFLLKKPKMYSIYYVLCD